MATAVAVALILGLSASTAPAATPREVAVDDTQVFPESITATPDGRVIFGSLRKPRIYRSAPGGAVAEPWIDVEGQGHVGVLGVLADATSNTLWACVMQQSGAPSKGPPAGHTLLRAYDLNSGRQIASYVLPGALNVCNDMTVGPDHSVYVSDTFNGRVLRLRPGARRLQIWLQDKRLNGANGITFLADDLYVNSVFTSHIYRVLIHPDGSPGALVDLKLSRPIKGPDGMRAAGDRMYLAEPGEGRVSQLIVHGNVATITVLRTGLQSPTAVSPVGGVVWVGESKLNLMPGADPGVFKAYALTPP